MHEPTITRLAALHCYRDVEPTQSSLSRETHYYTFGGKCDAEQQSLDQTLHSFATFVLSFVGDDDISFDFAARNAAGSSESGCVVARQGPGGLQLQTTSQRAQSDFAIALLADDDGPPELFLDKPFLATLSRASYTVRLALNIFPEPILQSICRSFLAIMDWPISPDLASESDYQLSPFAGTSVLNHPPLMTPPDFENQLGLPKSPSQDKTPLLHRYFSTRVEETPEKVAIDFLTPTGRSQCTYRELNDLSSILAARIRRQVASDSGTKGNIITVALNTSLELYVAWFGILKAGCIVAPVPADCPPELLQHMTTVTGSKIVIGSKETLPMFKDSIQDALSFEFIDMALVTGDRRESAPPTPELEVEVSKDDVAYILFTSGSTGKPKGVQITHEAATCAVAAQIAVASRSLEPGPVRWFQMVAPAFDMSVTEIFATLSIGGTLCACDRSMMLTDAESVINELGATVTLTTPSLAALLRQDKVPTLRSIWTGGEMLRHEIACNFAYDGDRATEDRATASVNGYGPTETTIFCTMNPKVSVNYRVSFLGPPLPTCSIIILDLIKAEQVMPMGFAGEIAVGGPHLSTGYLKSPEKTAAAFIEMEPFGRLYRTGDKGRLIIGPDGEPHIEFLGRLSSDQVKISGRRVELGEIEDGLKNPLVAEVAVVAMKSESHGEKQTQLVAVVSKSGTEDDGEVLERCKARARDALQPHMRPALYYLIDGGLPRLPSDKTDRKALSRLCSAPETSGLRLLVDKDSIREDDDAPLLDFVASAISKVSVTGGDGVTAGATLLSLGVDSLRSVRLLRHFRDAGVEDLQITDILSCRSVGELNAKVEKRLGHAATVTTAPNGAEDLVNEFAKRHRAQCIKLLGYEDHEVESILPTTTSQAVTLASYLLTADVDGASALPGLKAYIQHTRFYPKAGVVTEDLIAAWIRVLSRYDVMRTAFVPVDDDLAPFAQATLSPNHAAAQIRPHKYYAESDNEIQSAIEKAQNAANSSMTLQDPPRRLSVVQTPNQAIFIFSMLHSIFDGGSEAVLWEDVEREYLREPQIQRTGTSAAVMRHFSQDRTKAREYWESHMKDLNSPAFPCLRSTVPGKEELGCGGTVYISPLQLNTVTSRAASFQCSPLSIFQAAWAHLLFSYTGENDIAFGNVVSDRFTDDLINCSAPVLTVHPVRFTLEGQAGKSNIDVLAEATAQNTASLSYLHTTITGARYDTTLALQMYLNTGKGAELYDKVEHPGMQNDQAVMIEVYPHASGALEFRATYQYTLLDDSTAQSILEDLSSVVEHIISSPEMPFSGPIISATASTNGKAQATAEAAPSKTQLLHNCVANNSLKSPLSIALEFYDDLAAAKPKFQLTYAELGMRSDIIASFLLRRLGSTLSKSVIPICMEKCPEMYITILGIIKAGAAWCAIDPTYPAARQRLLIEQTKTELVLSSAATTKSLHAALSPSFEFIDATTLIALGTDPNPDLTKFPEPIAIKDSDIAYVIFTSGTTGTPKAVPISHQAASMSIDSFLERISSGVDVPGNAGRYIQFANCTFDVFVRDIFAAWKLSGTLVSASRDILLSSFTTLANEVEATHASMTPTFASTLNPIEFKSLRVVTMGGEKLPQALADEWRARMLLCNVYGPAETAINVTVNNFHLSSKSSNIGTALPTANAYVMVSEHPIMRYGLGELVISGVHLSPGYWDSTEGAGKNFRWNKFLNCRVYHTGDYVRRLLDGSFDFIGRKDDLVKIRGMRVEIGEISSVCSKSHELVAQAEVIYTRLPHSDQDALVCFMECRSRSTLASEKPRILETDVAQNIASCAKKHATSQLPHHMIPDIFIPLTAIPRNQSAKVNRKALLEILALQWSPDSVTRSTTDAADSQWSAQYQTILEKVRSVAKFMPEGISRTTTLAEIGIDSISAIRLSSKLKSTGHNISAIQVLESTTLDDLITSLTAKNEVISDWKAFAQSFESSWKEAVGKELSKDPSRFYTLPTTVFQDGMLIETMRSPSLYWGSFAWELSTQVDLQQLHKAWEIVCNSSDILRLSLLPTALLDSPHQMNTREEPSLFLQVIDKDGICNWNESCAESDDVSGSIKMIRDRFAAELHEKSFASPPWQVNIVSHGDRRIMVLILHHSLYDGDMIQHLMNDVCSAYHQGRFPERGCQAWEAFSRLMVRNNNSAAGEFWKSSLGAFAAHGGTGDSSDDSKKNGIVQNICHRTIELNATYPASRLSALARQLGASSLSPMFRVAFGSMLAEFSESENVLFGEVRSERLLHSRLVDAMAPLSATYPVPFRSSGSVQELVIEQQNLIMQSIRHGPPPTGQLRTILGKSSNDSLYPAVLVLHPDNRTNQDTSAPWSEMKDILDPAVDHEFALNIFEIGDDAVKLSLSVDETLMSAESQMLFLEQLDSLIVAFEGVPPDARLEEVTEALPASLISIHRADVVAQYPPKSPPTSYVEKWAEEHPDWKAVEVATEFLPDGKILTEYWNYRQFNETANQIANLLISFEISGRAVAVSLDRSLIAFAVIIGILKAGCTYVPVEASLPLDRKSFLLKDSQAAVAFVCEGAFDGVDLPNDMRLLDVRDNSFLEDIATRDVENIPNSFPPGRDAYLLYTSGSTGAPKGVRVGRQNLSAFNSAWGEFIGDVCPKSLELGGFGKFLCLASRAFDVHIGEMFLAWRFGLCAVTGERLSMLDDLPRTLSQLQVTHTGIVPSLLDQTGLLPEDVPHLAYLAVGGEKMTPKTQQIWSSSSHVVLVNAYGPTEVTVGCSAARILPDSDTRCIGYPLGDSVAHVLVPGSDAHVKKGMAGELVFEGSLVANGYLNRPDAKGFCEIRGQKMYRTGDIVRMNADNSILFLGRKDEQVKVRGQRLELGEVSEVVRSLSATDSDVVTLLLKHPDTSKQFLVAFMASAGAPKGTKLRWVKGQRQESLLESCTLTLPAYMVPDVIITVTTIPLRDTSAKTDAKALEQLFAGISLNELFGEADEVEEASPKLPSRELTSAEKETLSIMKGVLGWEEDRSTGPKTTLLQLGFDSSSSVKLSFTFRKLGHSVPVAYLLQNPTIEELCRRTHDTALPETITSVDSQIIDDQFLNIEKSARDLLQSEQNADVQSIRPCMPLQEVLAAHTITHASEEENEYISHMLFDLESNVSIEGVRSAWAHVIENHELLRTCFMRVDGHILQCVYEKLDSSAHWTDILCPAEELQKQLEATKKDQAKHIASHIDRVPPFRFTYATCNDVDAHDRPAVFMLSIHHALYDMASIKMIFADFETAYKGQILAPRPSILPLLKHIAAQQYYENASKDYWTGVFSGYSADTALAAPRIRHSAARRLRASLANIERMCSQIDTTVSALTQGIFGYVMSQRLERDDVVFGIVLSGRSVELDGIESMAAPCISTIPQRLCVGADGKTVLALAKTAQERLYKSMSYQYTSLRSLQKWLEISGPLFSSLFTFTKTGVSAPVDDAAKVLRRTDGEMALDFELALECEADSAADAVTLRTSSTMFETAEELDAFLSDMEATIMDVLGGQDKPITLRGGVGAPGNAKLVLEDSLQWSPVEEQIRDIVAAFSHSAPVEIRKNSAFIKYGIDSITAIQFSKMLRNNGLRVSGADVLRNPSVAKLAKRLELNGTLEEASSGAVAPTKAATTPITWSKDLISDSESLTASLHDITAVYPLTPLQAGMITATVMIDSSLYSHHHVVEIPEGIATAKVKAAWSSLVAKHDILRTSFHETKGPRPQLVGAVHQSPIINWTEIDTMEDNIDHLIETKKFSNMTAFQVPPVSASVIRSPRKSVLVISLHHATYDGISIGFIFQDLWAIIHDLHVPSRKPFYETALAIHAASAKSTSFWLNTLAGYQGAASHETNNAHNGVISRNFILTDKLSTLEKWCTAEGVTIQTVCQLVVGKAICAHSNTRDVVMGQVHAARLALQDADDVAGPVLNTVPLRVCLKDTSSSNLEHLRELQDLQSSALEHLHASLSDIQQLWRQANGHSEQLFDVLFVFRKGEDTQTSSWAEATASAEEDQQTLPSSQYDLVVEMHQKTDDSLQLQVYSKFPDNITEDVVALLVDSFESVRTHPGQPAVASPPLLSQLPAPGRVTDKTTGLVSYNAQATDRFLSPLIGILADATGTSMKEMDANTAVFAIGVDSIIAIRVAAACRRIQIPLTTMDILRNSKLGKLCEVALAKIEAQNLPQNTDEAPPGKTQLVDADTVQKALVKLEKKPEDVQVILPVLPGQELHLALWLCSGKTLYEPTWVFKTGTALDAGRLEAAWLSLIKRNDSLRTCFAGITPTLAVQAILKPDAPQLAKPFTVLRVPDSEDIETFTRSEIRRLYRSPSTLLSPPVHLYHVQGGTRGDAVLMRLHHTVYDAWSVGILIDELARLYRGGPEIVLPDHTDLSTFVEYSAKILREGNEESFWTQALHGCESTILSPAAAVPDAATPQRRPFVHFDCAGISRTAIESAAASYGVTVHCLLVVAFGRMLTDITTAKSCPVFGYYTAGRSGEMEGMDRLASPTVNMLPIAVPEDLVSQTALKDSDTQRESLQALQESIVARSQYEQSRLRDVLTWAPKSGQDGSKSRLFNVHLNILWNDEIMLKSTHASQEGSVFEPWPLGVPSDYASVEPLSAQSTVDGFDTSLVTMESAYADVGINPETGNLALGIGCHASLRDAEGLRHISSIFEKHLLQLLHRDD